MDRITNSRKIGPKVSLVITTALASALLAGCTTSSPSSQAESSFSKARTALKSGKAEKAITHAEEAVLAEPRNASARAMLGAAYLEAGRFEAAATSFKDALDLGDVDPRTTLSYALAAIAIGDSANAIAALKEREARINPADFGLAMALAGKPEHGIHVLTNALRGGQNSAKMRQNLAYTYALAGNWRAARVMAAEDVPADQLDKRLTEWAADSKPEDVMKRVAKLLGVNPQSGGQPAQLALVNFPDGQSMLAQADTPAARELGETDLVEAAATPTEQPARVASARPTQSETLSFRVDSDVDGNVSVQTIDPSAKETLRAVGAKTADVAAAQPVAAPRFVSNPVVQELPGRSNAVRAPAVARAQSYDDVVDPTVANILRATGAKTVDVAAPTAVAAASEVSQSPISRTASRYVSNPVVQKLPERAASQSEAPRRIADTSSQRRMVTPVTAPAPAVAADKGANSHLVQLGSYSSRAEAQNGWNLMQRKFPQLKDHDVVITKAQVNGKIFYRVAAAGFGPRSARSLCGTVKAAGRGCFAYAATNPPKGAIDNGVRIAARTP